MRRAARWIAATTLAVLLPMPALAACTVTKFADIPVTMAGRRAIVTTQINGREARFILDSGAFFSTVSAGFARDYGLPLRDLGNMRLSGIGGNTSLRATTAQRFEIAGQTVPHIDFAVGGSDTGYAGLLGQNLLGLGDVDYDLPHGVVRLLKAEGCKGANMAYWAGSKPFTIVPIEPRGADQRFTIGTVTVNGVKLKATFDTGASSTTMTLAAAKRLGITPGSPGVEAVGFSYGVGSSRASTWRAHFDLIDFGGEAIKKPVLEITDFTLGDSDMLVGIDFFLSHHLYVDNVGHRLFVTYEGGPVFGLNPKGATDSKGAALDLTDKAAEPTDAAGFSRRAGVLASGRRYDAALADLDRAVTMAPDTVRYLVQRAQVHLANRQPLLGAADLDRALTLAPADPDARLTRAQLRLANRDPAGALTDLAAADQALGPNAEAQLRLGSLYNNADAHEAAIASFDKWLKAHPEDSARPVAFNGRCWARGLLNRELDRALSDCDAALKLRPGDAAYLDSRALVRLRRGELDRAKADYDAAIAAQPRNALSLYARGIIERRQGQATQADTDQAAATAINAGVVDRAKRLGL